MEPSERRHMGSDQELKPAMPLLSGCDANNPAAFTTSGTGIVIQRRESTGRSRAPKPKVDGGNFGAG